MSKEDNKKIGIALMAVALMLLIATLVQYSTYTKTIKRCSETTNGTVTSVNVRLTNLLSNGKKGSRNNKIRHEYTYNAVFEVGNNTYTINGKSKSEKYKKDDTAVIHYDPNDPNKCYIEYCPPANGTKFLYFAVLFLVLGVVKYVKSR